MDLGAVAIGRGSGGCSVVTLAGAVKSLRAAKFARGYGVRQPSVEEFRGFRQADCVGDCR